MMRSTQAPIGKDAASNWIIAYLSSHLMIDRSSIEMNVILTEYGLDSIQAVIMSDEIGELIQREVSPTILYEYPTVDLLAAFMVKMSGVDIE